jgi:hypothetical protein
VEQDPKRSERNDRKPVLAEQREVQCRVEMIMGEQQHIHTGGTQRLVRGSKQGLATPSPHHGTRAHSSPDLMISQGHCSIWRYRSVLGRDLHRRGLRCHDPRGVLVQLFRYSRLVVVVISSRCYSNSVLDAACREVKRAIYVCANNELLDQARGFFLYLLLMAGATNVSSSHS